MLADADDVVVARCTITDDACVIEDTAGECAGCVADITIFNCWHMAVCLAGCIGSVMAGIATDRSHQLTAVVDERAKKAHGVMARAAVLSGHRMIDHHAGCRDSVVAGGAGLGHRIEDRVVESTARIERPDAMARHAIHVRQGMTLCLPNRVSPVVTGDTTIRYVAVVDIRRQECVCRVTETALTLSGDVPCIHARGRRSIVASGAGADIGAMVEVTTGQAIQEVIGIVAFIARLGRRDMKIRFPNGQNTVVALTANPKNFLVIDREDRGKPQGRMTRLTGIAGCKVIRRFPCNLIYFAAVALPAVR